MIYILITTATGDLRIVGCAAGALMTDISAAVDHHFGAKCVFNGVIPSLQGRKADLTVRAPL